MQWTLSDVMILLTSTITLTHPNKGFKSVVQLSCYDLKWLETMMRLFHNNDGKSANGGYIKL